MTPATVADTLVAPFNDLAAVEALFAARGAGHRRGAGRAGGGQHGRRAAGRRGSSQGLRAVTRRARRAAGLRRGHDRLAGAPGGARRCSTGSSPISPVSGKVIGGGLPAAAYGGRRDAHGADRPGGPGVPGRHAFGQPARDGRRARDAGRPGAAGRLGRAPSAGRRARRDAIASAAARGRRAGHGPAGRHDAHAVLHRRAGTRLRRRQAHRPGRLQRLLPRDARGRRLSAAVRVRGGVHLRRAR